MHNKEILIVIWVIEVYCKSIFFDWNSLEPFESLQLNQEKPFAMLLGFLANNFSMVCVVEQYLNLVHGTKIFGSYIGLYSTNLEIDSNSLVSAKGGGCAPNMG